VLSAMYETVFTLHLRFDTLVSLMPVSYITTLTFCADPAAFQEGPATTVSCISRR